MLLMHQNLKNFFFLAGHIVSSIPEAPEFTTASRHWNYWKNRLGFPYISNATQNEVLATIGHTAYLHCVVGNLGDRQVIFIEISVSLLLKGEFF